MIPLTRQAAVLPEVVVQGNLCAGVADREIEAEDGWLLAEAFKNAERVLTLEKKFSFVLKYQRVVTMFDSNYFGLGGSVGGNESRKNHSFWYAGRDSVEGFPSYRIDFAPTPDPRTIDWAGSILVDSASMRLLLADRHCVKGSPVEHDPPAA